MKALRQKAIQQIIQKQKIETQGELALALQKSGFKVTQTTICRDIKELGLVKMPSESGAAFYTLPGESSNLGGEERLKSTLAVSVWGVDSSENILVIKTAPGEASRVAIALDNSGWEEIIGTVAGDDTVLAVVKPSSQTLILEAKLKELSGG